ncbi:MAG: arylsulfatase [Oscillospiraceae bacterium]|nr:arylsulfatase [Oscillospiraceae bacterium]
MRKPNIILLFVDDLGYGDLSCLNPDSKIQTPNIDRLASEGMAFTDAHASSALCSPSRYGLLTGRYNWRSWLKSLVLQEAKPHLIEPGRLTLASMLKECGYQTGCVGKWHLGMDWTKTGPGTFDIDYTKPFTHGPCEYGFDYFYGMEASLDSGPYTYIENDHVVTVPTGYTGYEPFPHMAPPGRDGWSYGPIAEGFKHENVVPDFNKKVLDLLEQYHEDGRPFFLYYPTPAVHIPLVPTDEFRGKSKVGVYGDFVMELDACVGDVMNKLKELGIEDNTVFLFASDNGCSPAVDYDYMASCGHNPSYIYRGFKGDIYDGGHRIPCIVRWPGMIQPGSTCDQLVCLTDVMATLAELVGYKLPQNAGEDSISMLSLWEGGTRPTRRDAVHSSADGSFGIRCGDWKLELCPGSGGTLWTEGLEPVPEDGTMVQLYHMGKDVRETENVCHQYPGLVAYLKTKLSVYILNGRSTPGIPQPNTVPQWPQMMWVYDDVNSPLRCTDSIH